MISYKKFWNTLKRKNISTYQLIEKYNISSNTISRIRKDEYLSLRTIDDFCKILNCKIQDIVEFVPESNVQK